MIVNAAVLADFPADGHALEEIVFEDEIARVIPLREKTIFVERRGLHGMLDNVVLHSFESEAARGNGGEVLDPVGDRELFDGKLFWHGKEIIPLNSYGESGKEENQEQNTIFCRVIRLK